MVVGCGAAGFQIAEDLHQIAGILQRLGIAEAVKSKTLLSSGGASTSKAVAKGVAELGVQGISKTILAKGTMFAGPLPSDLQEFMTLSASVTAGSLAPEAARAFVAFLVRPSFRSKFFVEGLA